MDAIRLPHVRDKEKEDTQNLSLSLSGRRLFEKHGRVLFLYTSSAFQVRSGVIGIQESGWFFLPEYTVHSCSSVRLMIISSHYLFPNFQFQDKGRKVNKPELSLSLREKLLFTSTDSFFFLTS